MIFKLRVEQDTGLAWLVLVMSFLAHTINIGFSYAVVGNLTIVHMKLFGISEQKSGNISSIHIGLVYCLGQYLISCRIHSNTIG